MIETIADTIARKRPLIDAWYRRRLGDFPGMEPPIYSSVDVRNAGFKISVVDTNLFPSGFNNLCETFTDKASSTLKHFIETRLPEVRRVLILPEEHTRNPFYWRNVANLRKILRGAGAEAAVGSASTQFPDPFIVDVEGEETVAVLKLFLRDGFLQAEGFCPDLILMNNDLTAGTPVYLKDLRQVLLPSPSLGWHRRRKSEHFFHYQRLIDELGGILEIDPWLLSPLSTVETDIDLNDAICLKRLQEAVDRLLLRIRQKYLQYGIRREPYVFLKNDSGTYGLGMTHVESGAQLRSLNRRLRNKLESSKGGRKVSAYLIQEGIPTADLYRGKPIEPVVYLVGGEAVGTFFRIHEEKNDMENLNAPGMSFACLCFHNLNNKRVAPQLTCENRDALFTVASLLGQVASLASIYELHQVGEARKLTA